MNPSEAVTTLLQKFAGGEKDALDQLMPILYAELQRLAGNYLRNEKQGHTLQPTALVHEAYARLVRQDHPNYQNRAHFFGVAAQVMRQILVDHARGKNRVKRGGGAPLVSLENAGEIAGQNPWSVLELDDALVALEAKDAIKAKLVVMRFFGGLTAEESAGVLRMGVGEVRRHLRVAQSWLKVQLGDHAGRSE